MRIEDNLEKELDLVLKNFKENLLIIYDYKQKRATTANQMLEDYLCVAKEAELNLKRVSPNTAPVNVGIRYDILEKGYTLPKSIQDLIEKRTNQQS
jgi:hypothetical protein